ncbi:MAG: AbiH family protein [Ruminiclostridium sp.]
MSKKLFIIGNEFDRFHGIPSSYGHFREYLEEIGAYDFLRGISKFIDSDDIWSNFEAALGVLNEEELRECHSDSVIDYGDIEWADSATHDFQNYIEEDLKFANKIPYYFFEWIYNLNTDVKRLLRKEYINNDNIFLTFNYTDVLESVYDIEIGNILYIHGKANRGNRLITGHSNKNFTIYKKPVFNSPEEEEEYYENLQEQDFRERQANEIIKNYFKSTYKNVEAII